MKNLSSPLAVIFLCLGILALCLAPQALHRGDMLSSFVLIIIALIFWNRLQGKRS
jgi:lipopolysaccharide export LptBFGC system permease protein LptF